MLQKLNPNVIIVPLRALEPYYEPDESQRWTQCLRGKRVAVVNSFVDTMMKQLLKRERVWGVSYDSLLPNATYLFYKTGFSPQMAGSNRETRWPSHITDWRSAVSDIVKTVVANSPDIVLIGCGGLSMIVANELKSRNISNNFVCENRLAFSLMFSRYDCDGRSDSSSIWHQRQSLGKSLVCLRLELNPF